MLIDLQKYRDTRSFTHVTWIGDALCNVVNKKLESFIEDNIDHDTLKKIQSMLHICAKSTVCNRTAITKLKLGIIDFNKIFSSVTVEKDNKEYRYDWQIIGDETGIAFALFETRDSIDFKFHTKYHFDNRLFIDLTNGENHGSYQQLHLRSK